MTLALTADDVERVLASLAAEALALAPGEPVPAELDSLARVELAAAAGTFFGLDATGHEERLMRARTPEAWVAGVFEGWAAGPRELTFTTSGSTGTPVLCTHPWDTVAQEIDALAVIAGPGRRRVVGLVPHHHVYGLLFCVLLPRRLGIPFHDARAEGLGGLRAGDLVVGFPLRWELAARSRRRLPADVTGVTSTAPMPPEAVDALRALGLARMVEVYGSSETGGVGWREDPRAPLHPLPHWRLRPDGRMERADPARPGAWLAPVAAPDHLEPAGDGGFRVAGRRDRAVQVGGVNVSCDHVAGVLRRHPAVADCAVRPMTATEGRRLKAFVVPRDGAAPRADLRRWLDETLTPAERPTSLTFGSALPRTAQGKLADWPA